MKTAIDTFEAIYRDGALHPVEPLDLAEGARVRLGLERPARELGHLSTGAELNKFLGCLKEWDVDALEFQRRARAEWENPLLDDPK